MGIIANGTPAKFCQRRQMAQPRGVFKMRTFHLYNALSMTPPYKVRLIVRGFDWPRQFPNMRGVQKADFDARRLDRQRINVPMVIVAERPLMFEDADVDKIFSAREIERVAGGERFRPGRRLAAIRYLARRCWCRNRSGRLRGLS